MKLTDRFDDALVVGGRELKLNLAYDQVLRAMELWQDTTFTEAEKVNTFVEMFVVNKEELAGLDIQAKVAIVESIYKHYILDTSQLSDEGEIERPQRSNIEKAPYDLEKDAEYIFASFLYDYNIDLFDVQGKLHWQKFKSLLTNLSDESKFKQVVGIRQQKIPKPSKHNKEERDRIMKLKRIYRLEGEDSVEDIDAKADHLAAMLAPRKGGGQDG
ncbi:bacteriophage Gp15 protein [Salsuginibacillus halophilus]|uniref:Bacteriophage Gp15 protein n=1 Tax=Salsuginibacillus halophilus TaxID=517424 RepID=A0A2P8H648_9BACI|nr:Gp15 family bacteriophage protein [Salsuginibacillus halophilus]PSL41702.1 bacteriophage Gp15 protein [Salsuginibacillus halophilus]